jgi:hypothetical protein
VFLNINICRDNLDDASSVLSSGVAVIEAPLFPVPCLSGLPSLRLKP